MAGEAALSTTILPRRPAIIKPARFSVASKAKLKKEDYHENMRHVRALAPHVPHPSVFEAKYGTDMKIVLVMDNASYHHELNLNHEYFHTGKTPSNAPEGLCNVVLYKAGCRSIKPSHQGHARREGIQL